jgi:hypothetical protein
MPPLIDPRAWRMTEDRGPDSLDFYVRDLMAELGLIGYHSHTPLRDRRGFPDWEIWGTKIIHRELKSMRGLLSVDQRRVGSLITAAGGDWAVWRPTDFFNGTIRAQLERIAR